jgi:hypothetical protein
MVLECVGHKSLHDWIVFSGKRAKRSCEFPRKQATRRMASLRFDLAGAPCDIDAICTPARRKGWREVGAACIIAKGAADSEATVCNPYAVCDRLYNRAASSGVCARGTCAWGLQ